MMDTKKLKAIYEQVAEKTREYNQFMTDAKERLTGSDVLSFNVYGSEEGVTVQVNTKFYDEMDKMKMKCVRGTTSDYGNVHVYFEYEGMKVVACFYPEEVKK